MPAPLLAHAQTSRMALTNQDSIQASPPFKSSCLGTLLPLSKLSLVPALSSLPPIFLNQRAPNKDVTREGILVFSGVHSCWSGCAPQYGYCFHELTAALVIYARPADQACQDFGIDGGVLQVPLLTKEYAGH